MTGTNPPDEAIRTFMRWDLVSGQRRDPHSLFRWYQQLIHHRSRYPALSARDDLEQTSYKPLMTQHPAVYSYLRWTQDAEPFIVVVNFSDEPVEEYMIRSPVSPLEPGRYEVLDVLRASPMAECAHLQVKPRGRIPGFRPHLQLEPKSGYLLKLKPVREQ
jgi:glycosidase